MPADSNHFPVFTLFASEWIAFAVFLTGILLIIGLAEVIMRRFEWPAEASRKTVHILVGILIFWARFLFHSPVPAIVLALIFIGLNLTAIVSGGMRGMHGTARFSLGTVFYPLAFLILVLLFWERDPAVLQISFLILAFGDPLAAHIGETVDNPLSFRLWRDIKSIQGSATLFVTATLLTGFGLYGLRLVDGFPVPSVSLIILAAISVGIISTAAEAISWSGSDNLTLPLTAALALDIILRSDTGFRFMFFIWIGVALLFAFGAYRLRILTPNGAVVAFLLGTFVFGIGGAQFMIPLATFFVLSSLLSALGKQRKRQLHAMYEKTSNRDMMQVLANGGVAGILTVLWHFYPDQNILYYGFLGALAAATADTWGTELGAFARIQPRSILNFRPVAPGTSGGITPTGTTGVFLGSGALAISGWMIPPGAVAPLFQGNVLLTILIAGAIGALIDSVLGATGQAQYYCSRCGKVTERSSHCGTDDIALVQGYRWINNDMVNLACTASGAALAMLLLM